MEELRMDLSTVEKNGKERREKEDKIIAAR